MQFTLGGNDHAGARNPVQINLVTHLQHFIHREDVAHADQSGHQFGHFDFGDVVLYAAGQQLAEGAGFNFAHEGHAQALGAGGCNQLFQCVHLFGSVEFANVHLEWAFVANASTVELQLDIAYHGGVFYFDPGEFKRGRKGGGADE